jgi:uncharacterized sporulation protein YeaH/YhbH (DUF444 family)
MAKRFFILLYLFLSRTYDNIEVVIRHHTQAKEVDEEEFFHSRKPAAPSSPAPSS